jgi:hypothetical protein
MGPNLPFFTKSTARESHGWHSLEIITKGLYFVKDYFFAFSLSPSSRPERGARKKIPGPRGWGKFIDFMAKINKNAS